MKIAGIDYGSKLAGTTVIAFLTSEGQVVLFQSDKKKDADSFILKKIIELQPDIVGIDAPLSLPGVYTKPQQYSDYFYRKCDKTLKGMSPMFLGGLTARAIQLIKQPIFNTIQTLEIYPAALARLHDLKSLDYKKQMAQIPVVLKYLKPLLPFAINSDDFKNWHQVDALLALWSVSRYVNGVHKAVGEVGEGVIVY